MRHEERGVLIDRNFKDIRDLRDIKDNRQKTENRKQQITK
jgi:hypothetical protein